MTGAAWAAWAAVALSVTTMLAIIGRQLFLLGGWAQRIEGRLTDVEKALSGLLGHQFAREQQRPLKAQRRHTWP